MRTLFVHSGNMYGGVERVLEVIAGPHGAPLGPRFAICFDGRIAAAVRRAGVPLVTLGPVRMTRPDLLMAARKRLADTLATERPDVVVVPSVWTHVLFSSVARKAGLPVVLWVHDVLSPGNLLERLARRHAPDLIISNSAYSDRAARAIFPTTESRVVYCPASIDPPVRPRAGVRSALGVAEGTAVILTVGRMEPYKGHHVLIDALAILRDRTDWTWWCVGGPQNDQESQYFNALQDHARTAGLEHRVRFLGSRTDVADLLGAADIFCHPNSGAEPFGLVLVEAMQAGLPVLASALGGPAEIVTEACGRLVPPGDAEALARGLAEWLEHQDLRTQLGASGPARAYALCNPSDRIGDLASALTHVIELRRAA